MASTNTLALLGYRPMSSKHLMAVLFVIVYGGLGMVAGSAFGFFVFPTTTESWLVLSLVVGTLAFAWRTLEFFKIAYPNYVSIIYSYRLWFSCTAGVLYILAMLLPYNEFRIGFCLAAITLTMSTKSYAVRR